MEGSDTIFTASDKLDETRELILKEHLDAFRSELESRFIYEREHAEQFASEKIHQLEVGLADALNTLKDQGHQISILQKEVDQLKTNKIDLHKLAVVLSDLALQLMRQSDVRQ